jgi:nucleoside-diphosphate-sugar epimerase
MADRIVVLGYGAVGRAVVQRLCASGAAVVVAQRNPPGELPGGAAFRACDVLEAASVRAACQDAATVVLAIGFPYRGRVWLSHWPLAMGNVLAACEAVGARLVFVDNLYMYGPQTSPLREDMPLTDYGLKPRARATVTRLWEAARGRVAVAAVRPSDFYGDHAPTARLASLGIANLAKGKPAFVIDPPDTPHDFSYVPDIARSVETLIAAPDDAYGQAWHVPNAPTQTMRQLLQIAADALSVPLRLQQIPAGVRPLASLFNRDLAELNEMRFQFDRPYHVDHTKFAQRFWGDATPFEVGIPQVARAYRDAR